MGTPIELVNEGIDWAAWAGVAVGALTLFAAVAAALYARKAAQHAGESVTTADNSLAHAETTSARQLRAWLGVFPKCAVRDPPFLDINCVAGIKNHGLTPALDVRIVVRVSHGPIGFKPKIRMPEMDGATGLVMMPGADNIRVPEALPAAVTDDVLHGRQDAHFYGAVFYRDGVTDEVRETRFCFQLCAMKRHADTPPQDAMISPIADGPWNTAT